MSDILLAVSALTSAAVAVYSLLSIHRMRKQFYKDYLKRKRTDTKT
jgi:hypothetical protein